MLCGIFLVGFLVVAGEHESDVMGPILPVALLMASGDVW